MADDKTEKATPKKRNEARQQGTVAKSADVNGVAVLLVGVSAIAITAPMIMGRLEASMSSLLQMIGDPSVVSRDGLGVLFGELGSVVGLTVGPIAAACMIAGLLANVAQVKWKPSFKAIKPKPSKLNPISGAKQLLGKRAIFETAKSLAKVSVVGGVVFMVMHPKISELASLVGMPPQMMVVELAKSVLSIALRAIAAYVLIAAADYGYQRYSTEKSLKMTKDEVKQEYKNAEMSGEIKGARKRRQMETARARMMQDVPDADVIVTNPTHYSVALKYSSDKAAPIVVAKGKDLIAFRIREIAAENGVPVVPDPPLARSLHASVEVGQMIPEELYQAVAQLLAFVYRSAGQRRAVQLQSPTPVAA